MIVAFYSNASYAGKDSCADFAAQWCERHEIPWRRDAFAWRGKVVCADALGYEGTPEQKVAFIDDLKNHGEVHCPIRAPVAITVNGDGLYRHPIGCVSGREFIIGLLGDPETGTGVRGIDEGFWTRQVLLADRPGVVTLLSDARFLEEGEALRGTDARIVEVVRDESIRFNEQRWPDEWIHHVIRNDGTLDDLQTKVDNVMRSVLRATRF